MLPLRAACAPAGSSLCVSRLVAFEQPRQFSRPHATKQSTRSKLTCRRLELFRGHVAPCTTNRAQRVHSRARKVVCAAAEGEGEGTTEQAPQASAPSTPRNSSEAITAGQALFAEANYDGALSLFQDALTLPGSAALRVQGSIRETSCASDGEMAAALYNMACCYVKMGQPDTAVDALGSSFEAGFDQFDELLQDPDLASIKDNMKLKALILANNNPLAKMGRENKKKSQKKGLFDRW